MSVQKIHLYLALSTLAEDCQIHRLNPLVGGLLNAFALAEREAAFSSTEEAPAVSWGGIETTLYYIKIKLSIDRLSDTFDTLMNLSSERAKKAHRLSGGEEGGIYVTPTVAWEDHVTIFRRLEAQAQRLQDFVSSASSLGQLQAP